jgi:hypothetical protein
VRKENGAHHSSLQPLFVKTIIFLSSYLTVSETSLSFLCFNMLYSNREFFLMENGKLPEKYNYFLANLHHTAEL